MHHDAMPSPANGCTFAADITNVTQGKVTKGLPTLQAFNAVGLNFFANCE